MRRNGRSTISLDTMLFPKVEEELEEELHLTSTLMTSLRTLDLEVVMASTFHLEEVDIRKDMKVIIIITKGRSDKEASSLLTTSSMT